MGSEASLHTLELILNQADGSPGFEKDNTLSNYRVRKLEWGESQAYTLWNRLPCKEDASLAGHLQRIQYGNDFCVSMLEDSW